MPGQKPGSIGQLFMPGESTLEVHSSTCAHCQYITEIPSMRKMHEHVDVCRNCMKLICLRCAGKPCFPWMKIVDYMESRDAAKHNMLKDMGWLLPR